MKKQVDREVSQAHTYLEMPPRKFGLVWPKSISNKRDWTPTMLAIEELIRRKVFKTADVLEFAELNREAFQSWFKRGWLADPAPGGPGNPRVFALYELSTIVMGRHVGQLGLGKGIEASMDVGAAVTDQCFVRWLQAAQAFDATQVSTGAEPQVVLHSLIADLGNGLPDFLVLLQEKAKAANPHCSLGDIFVGANEPYFTALDVRTPMFQYFYPMAQRLFKRTSLSGREVKELEDLFAS